MSPGPISFVLAAAPSTVAVFLVAGAYLTGLEAWAIAGLIWTLVGGGWTLMAIFFAATNAVMSYRAGARNAGRLYVIVLILAAVNVPMWWVCTFVGERCVSSISAISLTVTNNTSVPIDRVVVHFAGREPGVSFVAIPPGGSRKVAWVRPESGTVRITVSAAGESLEKVDIPHLGDKAFKSGHFTVYVEPAELPPAAWPRRAATSPDVGR